MHRFGGKVEDAEPPARAVGGRDYATYLAHFSGEELPLEWAAPLVARLTPIAGRYELLRREARLQGWCAEHGFPAPAVLIVLSPGEVAEGPVEVMERLPGRTVADAIAEGRTDLANCLGALLGELHDVPVPPWAPQQDPQWSAAERRLALARFVAAQDLDVALRSSLALVERLLPSLEVPDPVVCHGDFHPYNVLVEGDSLGVIDWTDAGSGDRHADIAWSTYIFEMAARSGNVPPELLRNLSRSFLASYERRHAVDPVRVARWRPLALLHHWAMTVAEASGLWGGNASVIAIPRERGDQLRLEFEAAMLAT